MATVEFLNKRIAGKIKELETLNKKLVRIQKAKDSNWKKNPYYYSEHDLSATLRDIELAQKSLEEYKAQLQSETEKSLSRSIPVITEFLERWKANSIKWFTEQRRIYLEVAKPEYYARNHEYCENWNNGTLRRMSPEDRKKYSDEYHEYEREFKRQWMHVTQFEHGDRSWEENLERDLEAEKNRKYDFIIERTNEIVGQITDASNLTIGAKGDLNGFILGTKGAAKVQTIGAGGYNIQCFHFRTLIHKM